LASLTQAQLRELFKRIRIYRIAYWVYAASAVLYGAAAWALSREVPPAPYPLATLGLLFGIFVVATILLGRWLFFRPSTLRARKLSTLEAMVRHTFQSLLFLLALGESLGMAAVALSAGGAAPSWKLLMLCLWQLMVSLALTPEQAHWDRLLTRWGDTFSEGGAHDAP
jgi:hypothetical protein